MFWEVGACADALNIASGAGDREIIYQYSRHRAHPRLGEVIPICRNWRSPIGDTETAKI